MRHGVGARVDGMPSIVKALWATLALKFALKRRELPTAPLPR
jgi:hypothetical protein